MSDNVNHPPHYTVGGLEVIDILQAKFTPEMFKGFVLGNVLKYLFRLDHKDAAVQDAEKAAWYLNRLITTLGEEATKVVPEAAEAPTTAADTRTRVLPHAEVPATNEAAEFDINLWRELQNTVFVPKTDFGWLYTDSPKALKPENYFVHRQAPFKNEI